VNRGLFLISLAHLANKTRTDHRIFALVDDRYFVHRHICYPLVLVPQVKNTVLYIHDIAAKRRICPARYIYSLTQ